MDSAEQNARLRRSRTKPSKALPTALPPSRTVNANATSRFLGDVAELPGARPRRFGSIPAPASNSEASVSLSRTHYLGSDASGGDGNIYKRRRLIGDEKLTADLLSEPGFSGWSAPAFAAASAAVTGQRTTARGAPDDDDFVLPSPLYTKGRGGRRRKGNVKTSGDGAFCFLPVSARCGGRDGGDSGGAVGKCVVGTGQSAEWHCSGAAGTAAAGTAAATPTAVVKPAGDITSGKRHGENAAPGVCHDRKTRLENGRASTGISGSNITSISTHIDSCEDNASSVCVALIGPPSAVSVGADSDDDDVSAGVHVAGSASSGVDDDWEGGSGSGAGVFLDTAFMESPERFSNSLAAIPTTSELARKRRLLPAHCRRHPASASWSPDVVPETPSPVLVGRGWQVLQELRVELQTHSETPPASCSTAKTRGEWHRRDSCKELGPSRGFAAQWDVSPGNFITIDSDDDGGSGPGDAALAWRQVQVDEDEALALALQVQFDAEEAERLVAAYVGGVRRHAEEPWWHHPSALAEDAYDEPPSNQRWHGAQRNHRRRFHASMHVQQRSPNNSGDDYEELLRLDGQLGPASHCLSATEIHRLPTQVFLVGAHKPNSECSICKEAYAEGELMRTLPCLHAFHAACIDRWLQLSDMCPVCRTHVVLE